MFTGIIQELGRVSNVKGSDVLSVLIERPGTWKIKLGESIAVNGVCSTVAHKSAKGIGFDYMRETLRVSAAGNLHTGDTVNLERSLRHGDPIDGHFVSGHIDCVGVVKEIKLEGKSKVIAITISKEFLKYIAYKGSVTIDGVALTVSKKLKGEFEVSLVPYTLKHTNLDKRKMGDKVNIECDMVAKYLVDSIR